jgi:hypothetical protein
MEPVNSISLDELSSPSGYKKIGNFLNIKVLVALFLIFILVVSDVFNNNFMSAFSGSMNCRNPTSYGVILQGIFLVIFFIGATFLIQTKIL